MIFSSALIGLVAILAFVLLFSLKSFGINREYQRGVPVPVRPARPHEGPWMVLAHPVYRPGCEGRHPHHHFTSSRPRRRSRGTA